MLSKRRPRSALKKEAPQCSQKGGPAVLSKRRPRSALKKEAPQCSQKGGPAVLSKRRPRRTSVVITTEKRLLPQTR